jgi:hypothetical protein
VSVPEAAAALGAAMAVLEDVRRTPGATGAALIAARADVELGEHRLEVARRWEDGAPQRAALAEAEVHARALHHNATKGEQALEAAMGQVQAAVDTYNRLVRETNNGNKAAMAFIREKGHLLPPGHAEIRNGGEYVRIGGAAYCGRSEVFVLGFIAFHDPGRIAPPAAPAPAGCPHRNVARRTESIDRASGLWGSRICLDCGEQISPPDPGYAPPAPPEGGAIVIGPTGKGSLPV